MELLSAIGLGLGDMPSHSGKDPNYAPGSRKDFGFSTAAR